MKRLPHAHAVRRRPPDEEDSPTADVVHATHAFAYVPTLVRGRNIVFDEHADFGHGRIQLAVSAWLRGT